jgi:Protein of unknown function (DUF1353)
MKFNRRNFLVSGTALGLCNTPADAQPGAVTFDRTKEDWLDALVKSKGLGEQLHVSKFVERIYYLNKPIAWFPNPGQERLRRVDVPVGFITDFASIPAPFWPLLPPDGEYTYPAIVHDYLYWDQGRPRDEADEILKLGMEDLHVSRWKIEAIYGAVRVFGGGPWDENARLKNQGEKRCIKVPASADATTRWENYRKRTDVFCD